MIYVIIYVVIKAMFGLLINHNISLAIEIVPFLNWSFNPICCPLTIVTLSMFVNKVKNKFPS